MQFGKINAPLDSHTVPFFLAISIIRIVDILSVKMKKIIHVVHMVFNGSKGKG